LKRKFQGIWIPASVWLDRSLSLLEKVLLVEISSLHDRKRGGCYASNGYFADFFKLSCSRISEVISRLRDKGYLVVQLSRETRDGKLVVRRILRVEAGPLRYSEAPLPGSRKDPSENRKPPSEKAECINPENIKENIFFSARSPNKLPRKELEKLAVSFLGKPLEQFTDRDLRAVGLVVEGPTTDVPS